MSTVETFPWLEANQRYLMAEVARIRRLLEAHVLRVRQGADAPPTGIQPFPGPDQPSSAMTPPPALETLVKIFSLSPFERDMLLLCAGVELDSSLAAQCAAAQGDERKNYPTFSLALAALPEANWSAISPASPLRYWRLVEPAVGPFDHLTTAPLRIDERILHYLTGLQYTDERLKGFIHPAPGLVELVPSHLEIARQAIASWNQVNPADQIPVLQLFGPDSQSQRAIAAAICSRMGMNLQIMSARVIPLDARELEALVHLWERESILSRSALLFDCSGIDASDAARSAAVECLIEGIRSALILAGRDRRAIGHRPALNWEVRKPTSTEQRLLWQQALGSSANGRVDPLVAQFNLNASVLQSVCDEALQRASGESEGNLETIIWDTCRVHARPNLDELAQKIESAANWADLVLPQTSERLLKEIVAQVKHRLKVYETWGFGSKSSRGLGISALFVGPSGTGKTLAAEVLANHLRLDLYRIDLSQVVSKYIGETEKNLRRVFDAAEDSGAILLFDEADALFGKRSEVKDSHDRYANIEVSYLLQRMESYRGLAILTTNLKEALDKAFLRRIRFVVPFPFPNAEQRAEIWRRIFPAEAPLDSLQMEKLAQLNMAGGNIRNIALWAAFLAADAGESVSMGHLLRAARVEYAKLEKALTDIEIRGWL
ncbi:MAG: ATP-binding protein [Dehalococcoidia bacterium]|nr:ATP-binding protein [Dehalococcoidia bacterium]